MPEGLVDLLEGLDGLEHFGFLLPRPGADEVIQSRTDCPGRLASALALRAFLRNEREAHRRTVVTRDDDFLTGSHFLDQVAEMAFCFPEVDPDHGYMNTLYPSLGSRLLSLGDATSPELVALGSPEGFLTSASLAPFSTVEVEATVQ